MVVRGFHKKPSKRLTTKKRVKIEKKIREHHKKVRKQAKKIPTKATLRRKDPGVPNSLPFKDEILREAKRLRDLKEAQKEAMKQQRKEARAALKAEKRSLASLAEDATSRCAEFEQKEEIAVEESERSASGKAVEGSLKAYSKEFNKVIEAADVILEVLDARDPLGSRCPQVEQAVISAGVNKKLVLLINKIDLVPKENVEAWLKYLRNELPTVAFKSSTQIQKNRLSQRKVPISRASQGLITSSSCLGADVLLKLLGNYSRKQGLKTAIRVGVVGFPNTGKSSVINSLKRSKACDVGNTPGVTKTMQEVHLDKTVRLLDCPGIIMASDKKGLSSMLRNAVKIEKIADPETPVEVILSRFRKDQIMMQYKIPMYKDSTEFLHLLAKRCGMVKKGGLLDITKAARVVLRDWSSGKITYYTQPPEIHTLSSHLSTEIVAVMSKEFDIDALCADEQKTLQAGCKTKDPVASTIMESEGLTEEMEDESAGEMIVEEISGRKAKGKSEKSDLLEAVIVPDPVQKTKTQKNISEPTPRRKTRLSVALATRSPVTSEDLQLNAEKKKEMKKMKKQRKRADKLATDLSDALETGLAGIGTDQNDDAYDENEIV